MDDKQLNGESCLIIKMAKDINSRYHNTTYWNGCKKVIKRIVDQRTNEQMNERISGIIRQTWNLIQSFWIHIYSEMDAFVIMHALPIQELGHALEQFWRDDTRKLAFIGLHWLPVRQRAIYKTAVITHIYRPKNLKTGQPVYLTWLASLSISRRQGQSKAFSIMAAAVWNSLSPVTKSSATITTFKAYLKVTRTTQCLKLKQTIWDYYDQSIYTYRERLSNLPTWKRYTEQ